MEMIGYSTKYFKDIFPDYDTFKSWYQSTGLSAYANDVPKAVTFRLIANEYNDSHVNLSDESFKEHFANDIYTYYKEFEATTQSIIDLMNLTDDEIAIADNMITNFAQIPETESSTNVEEVDFISNQQKIINKKGLLQIKREQLANKRIFTVKTFLNRFRHLFIKIISPAYTYVVGEPDEE